MKPGRGLFSCFWATKFTLGGQKVLFLLHFLRWSTLIHRGASEARRWAFPCLAFVFRRTQFLLMLSTTTIVHSEGRCLLLRLDLLHRPCETRPHPHLLPGCLPPSRTQDPPRDLDSVGRVSVGARETGAKEQGRAIETAHAEIRRSLSPMSYHHLSKGPEPIHVRRRKSKAVPLHLAMVFVPFVCLFVCIERESWRQS